MKIIAQSARKSLREERKILRCENVVEQMQKPKLSMTFYAVVDEFSWKQLKDFTLKRDEGGI